MPSCIIWTLAAWEDYQYWQTQDRKTLIRINRIINDCLREPFDGIGKPEPLNRDFPLGAPSALRSRQRRVLGHFRVFSSPMEQPLARQQAQNCLQNPLAAIERPNGNSRLKENLTGFWSRRIDIAHRLVYCVDADDLVIITCRYHYDD